MSTALDSFKLTQHTDMRVLQFENSKLQDQNLVLKTKLKTLEQMYRNANLESLKQKQELKAQKQKLKQQYLTNCKQEELNAEVLKGVSAAILKIKNQMSKLQVMGIDVGINDPHQYTHLKDDSILEWLDVIWNCMLTLINKSSDLALKFQKQVELHRTGQRIYRKSQNELRDQLNYLSQELNKLQKVNSSLVNELNLVRRQNNDFKLQLYESTRQKSQEQSQSKIYDATIEDNNFTVDLLHFQKQLLQKVVERILATIQQDHLGALLTDTYSSYEKVSQIFRQKLQVEYDLQDLERQYKRDKNSQVCEKLLIELRKQIQDFRKQLHKQKDLLVKQQNQLEMCFVRLAAQEKQHKHIRSHTVQIQKQLNNLQQVNHDSDSQLPNRQTKREWEESRIGGSSRIRFRASGNSQEVMREVVRKDRENIEKLLRQTRQTYMKSMS